MSIQIDDMSKQALLIFILDKHGEHDFIKMRKILRVFFLISLNNDTKLIKKFA